MVEHNFFSNLTENAIRYAWRQLAERAGLPAVDTDGNGFESLGIEVNYGIPQKAVNSRLAISVIPARAGAWKSLLNLPKGSIDWLPIDRVISEDGALPNISNLPVFLWGEGYEDGRMPFAEAFGKREIVIYADIIAATLFMLTRWEEIVVPERDLHERFPASASLAFKQGFLDRPLVDEYAMVLRCYLQNMLPGWEPIRQKYQVILSHDIDTIRSYRNLFSGIKSIAGDVLKRLDFRQGLSRSGNLIKDSFWPERAAGYQGISKLAQVSLKNNLSGTYFFLTGTKSIFDSDFSIGSPIINNAFKRLMEDGFQIGIHPSYHTLHDLDRLLDEKSALEKVLGMPIREGRQHYLRFLTPTTWRYYEQAGLEIDSSLTYADHEGFRAGTCHPFRPFDIQYDREMNLVELPLVVMDGTLRQYRALSLDDAETSITDLAKKCRNVEGSFTMLWHNSSTYDDWEPWFEMYQRLLPTLM